MVPSLKTACNADTTTPHVASTVELSLCLAILALAYFHLQRIGSTLELLWDFEWMQQLSGYLLYLSHLGVDRGGVFFFGTPLRQSLLVEQRHLDTSIFAKTDRCPEVLHWV